MSSKKRRQAIELLNRGREVEARQLLAMHIQQNPHDKIARRWYLETFHNEKQSRSAPSRADNVRTQPSNPPSPAPEADKQNRSRPIFVASLIVLTVFLCGFLSFSAYVNKLLGEELSTLQNNYQILQQSYRQIDTQHQALSATHSGLQNEYAQTLSDLTTLQTNHQTLQGEHDALIGEYNGLVGQFNALGQDYGNLSNEYNQFRMRSIAPPYIYVHERTVELAFSGSEDRFFRWHVPFESLEANIIRGNNSRNSPSSMVQLRLNENETVQMVDFRPYIDPQPFRDVIPHLYHTSERDSEFIWEVWQIIVQLTAYSSDIGETPRFPLETLLAAGGDCEDTAILFASMIKAAPVDWEVSLVYMDSNNPTNPQEINHVLVRIDTGSEVYNVETTSKQVMNPFTDGILGWRFPIEG